MYKTLATQHRFQFPDVVASDKLQSTLSLNFKELYVLLNTLKHQEIENG
jgi:type II secretory pathway component HofQ